MNCSVNQRKTDTRHPTPLPLFLTIVIGSHSLLLLNWRFSHWFTARIILLMKFQSICVTVVAWHPLPLPSHFANTLNWPAWSFCLARKDFYGTETGLSIIGAVRGVNPGGL